METINEKAKRIRLLILDVDGVLTSGVIYYGSQGSEIKGFYIHDGLGIRLLQKTGVMVAVISGKKSEAVSRRVFELEIKHAYQGYDEKLPAYEDLKQKLNLSDDVIAFIGDDLQDLPLLRRAGLAITVAQAPTIVKQHADWVTEKKGGKGAVREACEFILEAQGNYHKVLEPYLKA